MLKNRQGIGGGLRAILVRHQWVKEKYFETLCSNNFSKWSSTEKEAKMTSLKTLLPDHQNTRRSHHEELIGNEKLLGYV